MEEKYLMDYNGHNWQRDQIPAEKGILYILVAPFIFYNDSLIQCILCYEDQVCFFMSDSSVFRFFYGNFH